MTHEIFNSHVLPRQQVKANAQGCEGGVELGAQEIGQVHPAVRIAQNQGKALIQVSDALPCQIIHADHPAAVRIGLQTLLVQPGVEFVGGRVNPEKPGSLPKHSHPDVHVVGAVVAVDFRHRTAGGGGYVVDLRVKPPQGLIHHDIRENRGARGDVARVNGYAVGSHHTGAPVSRRRSKGKPRLQGTPQPGCPRLGQPSGRYTGGKHTRQQLLQLPGHGILVQKPLGLFQHGFIVIRARWVDGEHAGSIIHAQHILAGKQKMHIARQRRQVSNPGNMILSVQQCLIQVSHAPTLGNVILQQLGQGLGSLPGGGILPGAERCQQIPVLVEGQVAVHHGGHAGTADGDPFRDFQLRQNLAQAVPDLRQIVGPDAVFVAADPGVPRRSHRGESIVHQNRLDPGGAQFDAQKSTFRFLLLVHCRFPLSKIFAARPPFR